MNILVVDDSPTNRKLLRVTLEPEGHTVFEAGDGVEALSVLQHGPVDAIVSDILMPNMDGYRLCHELRRNEKFKHLAFIHYTSTYTSPGDRKLSETVGADEYLTKPVSTHKMLETLQETVAKSAERKSSGARDSDTRFIMKEYSAALVKKLEERNLELELAQTDLFRANKELAEHAAKIEQLNAELDQRVRERTAELESVNGRLELKNREIGYFYHTLSHELKTPLTSAREFISILLDGLDGPVNGTQAEHLAIARESCDQIRVCLDDLLDTTRLETGKFKLDARSGSLANLIQLAVTALSSRAAARQIALTASAAPGLPPVCMDARRITQVITNLVNNAIKFTPPDGRIEITAGAPADAPGFLRVSVSDTGRGIPAEELDRIFDRLHQVKPGDASSEHGIGLGLYLCRQLVELHGGRITVASEPGKGSTFSFTLPADTGDTTRTK